MNFQDLSTESRLLLEVDLQPLLGHSFQPTGFPDLGAATYKLPGKDIEMLILESAQSVANRLENTIWDEAKQAVVEPLTGISYVEVRKPDDDVLTNSLLEAHRLNSYYILEGKDKSFFNQIKTELEVLDDGPVNFQKLATVLAKYDVNSLLHGIFIAKQKIAGGRFKLPRALSGFIEAYNVNPVESGGVKNDRVNPKGDTKSGAGNVPYHRTDYTAESITAYFNLDLSQIRGYRLGAAVEDLLIAMAIWKIQRFLDTGLRLRSNCDLECVSDIRAKRPSGYQLPDHSELTKALPDLVKAAASAFANPPVTVVQYEGAVSA